MYDYWSKLYYQHRSKDINLFIITTNKESCKSQQIINDFAT